MKRFLSSLWIAIGALAFFALTAFLLGGWAWLVFFWDGR